MSRNYDIPSLQELEKFNVNRGGQFEAVRQTLYDYQAYAQAGQTQLTFFQLPVGQGNKTLADTNMEIAGQLPNPKMFLIQSIEILFFPSGTGTALPSFGGLAATAAAATSAFVNDVYNVGKSGWLEMFIGSKPYLREAPLNRFPPKSKLDGFVAWGDSSTAGAVNVEGAAYAVWSGRPYMLTPPILLKPTQNFNVTLNWPAAVALAAIDTAARIGVVLDGILYRNSQ